MDSAKSKMNVSLLTTILIALLNSVLVPVIFSMSGKISQLQTSQAKTEAFVESFTREGPRFTENDFVREQSITLRILESQGKSLDDHETRIRQLERKP